jgi:hypothetical protein
MPEKRKSTSIRALEELHDHLTNKCKVEHGKMKVDGHNCYNGDYTKETTDLKAAKEKIIKKISKEIEEYAIKKYTDYGLIIVPVCHRRSSDGEDRLEIDLKVKTFIGVEKEIEAKAKADAAYARDMVKVETWFFDALKSVALKEELPEMPEFTHS